MSTPGPIEGAATLRFRGWEIRPADRCLLVDGEAVRIGHRAFELLLALVQRRGEALSKDALMQAAWAGLVVEENNLTVQIAGLRKLLGAEAIATVPGYGYRLSAPAAAEPAPAGTAAEPALCGREADLRALQALGGSTALLSIVGTGGIGKTSLLKALLARAPAPDAVHWVDLAPLRDGGQIVSLVAKSMGIELGTHAHAREDLVSALSRSSALLALDNCEHLLADVAAFVDEALRGAPGLRWVVTSQWPLRVQGELVYRLDPLGVPPEGSSAEEALRHGAVELLCRRAAAADRHFRVDAQTVATVIDICRQLDGLPLALELAAARVATLGLGTVHEQLGQRLRFLAGPRRQEARHHSLRSTLDWSHSLLSSAEQRVFRRLEPFAGSFGVPQAQQLAADEIDEIELLELLSSLVEKSFVQRQPGPAQRFYLFASAREYAASQLAAAGESDRLHRRHAEVMADWFDAVGEQRPSLRDERWMATCAPERDNVRAALAWACGAGDAGLLARLVTAAAQIDASSHRVAELAQCEIPLALLLQAPLPLRAAACLELSWVHYADGSRDTGTELGLRALEDCRALNDTAGTYRALAQLIRLYESRPGTLPQAAALWEELQRIDPASVPLRARLSATIAAGYFYERAHSVERLQELDALARSAGYDELSAVCRAHVVDRLLIERRFGEAAETAARYRAEAMPPTRARALVLINQASALIQLGRVDEALEPAFTALRSLPSAAYVVVDGFALAVARQGRFEDAALLAGYGARVRRERDERPDPAEAAMIEETLALLDAALPVGRRAELMLVGAALSTAEALAMLRRLCAQAERV